jgi:hypothetical protein
MPFKRPGHAEQSHDAITQRTHHGAAKALHRIAHPLHGGPQLLHGLLRIQAGDMLGGTDDVGKQDGGVLERTPLDFRRQWSQGTGGLLHTKPKGGATVTAEPVGNRVHGQARYAAQRHLF